MILEFFQYIFESSSSHARSFGHLHESIAILQRQKRNQKAWSPHQENCKSEIISFCNNLKYKDSILILGSGPLHEIPISYLQENFKKVTLVDIVHLNYVRKIVSQFHNVELIEHDISEIESELTNGNAINKIPSRFINENYSAVISANLMSQIPLNLKKYIERHQILTNENEIENFCNLAYRHHFDYLNQFSSSVLLITDIKTELLDRKGNVIETETPTTLNILPKPHKVWIWKIAPKGEINRDLSLQMKVASIILK